MTAPNTSVIMPCFNHGHFVAESAAAILNQSDRDLELIIVDDRSSDNSWEVIQQLAKSDARIRAIRHDRNQGASRSRNDGLQAASGEFIGFCDADDIWEPNKLEFQLRLLRNNPSYDVTYCDSTIIDEKGVPTGKKFSDRFPGPKNHSGSLFRELITHNFINMQTVLMRKSCLQRGERFDENIKWVEDWWFWIELSGIHRFLHSPEQLAKYRVHSASTNLVHKRDASINRIRVFRKILLRFTDLPRSVRANIYRNIGGELCDLGKQRIGCRTLRHAVKLSLLDVRAISTCLRAGWRLLRQNGNLT
jgi:glycosyltransferase involved in cell wall biosynthesis